MQSKSKLPKTNHNKDILYVQEQLLLTNVDDYLGKNQKVRVHAGSKPNELLMRYRYPKCVETLYSQDFKKNTGKVHGKPEMFILDKERVHRNQNDMVFKTTSRVDY